MKTEFIPIDYDYFDFNGRNYAKIIGRNAKGKRVCIIDSCPVYLWAILKDKLKQSEIDKLVLKIEKIKLDVKGRKTKVEKVEVHEKNFLGKKVKALKVFATNYKDLHDIADKLGTKEIVKRRGYDLGYVTHYIIEKKIIPLNWYEISGELLNNSEKFGGIDKSLDVDYCIKLKSLKSIKEKKFMPKTLAYDIETDELKIGEGEILMISLVSEEYKKVITWKKYSGKKQDYVEYVENEKELIKRFIECVKEVSPDFLVGYFSDGFDLPYLKARADKHRVKLSLGLDGSVPRFSRGINLTGRINGVVHLDIIKFIKTAYAQYMQSETLSLNDVSKEFLGEGKKDFTIKHSSKINKEEWDKYYEYNLHDSVLAYGLFEKFWPDMLEFSRVMQEPVFDVSRYGLSKQVESYILHNLEKFNEIPEKRPGYDEISQRKHREKVEGAFVLEPTPGLYKNIAIFDFTSMHTSIIISMNISKSTLLEKPEKNSFNIETKTGKFYFSKKPGFIPLLLKEILEKRKRYKQEYKKNPDNITKARSNAFKVLSASVHGYIGFFGARYFSLESSSAILAFVRKYNKETIKKIEEAGYKVIFADTDSTGFLMNKKSKTEIKKFLKEINSKLPGVMELGLEGFFEKGLWVSTRGGTIGAKKKYALIDEKGKVKIRGFETVRRDWCGISRKMQDKVIKLILKNGNEKKALEYVKEVIKDIKNRKISKEDLIIRSQLKKPISEYKLISPHVIAAKKMKEQNIPLSQGNLIAYYIAESKDKKKLVRDKVKLPEEKGEYDIQYYLERQILPAVENIFQVFKINIKEVIDGKKQMTLGDF
ncbi:MAG: DNA-directed DNA polymerase [Nanoarchaeota archaeon]|nr:DNA-directed DNA polymerase [Nanoarchaeota archaeon]MBU4116446.1 DNA-directed DNA polymerase [Nanoarchaeota archaeon]